MSAFKTIVICGFLTSGAVACGGAGMGKGVHTDISAQMQTIEPAIASCYKDALHKRSRRIAGTMVVGFKVEPKTGKFKNATVLRSDLNDPELEACVVNEVTTLVLAKPQSTIIGIDDYPIRFSPSN